MGRFGLRTLPVFLLANISCDAGARASLVSALLCSLASRVWPRTAQPHRPHRFAREAARLTFEVGYGCSFIGYSCCLKRTPLVNFACYSACKYQMRRWGKGSLCRCAVALFSLSSVATNSMPRRRHRFVRGAAHLAFEVRFPQVDVPSHTYSYTQHIRDAKHSAAPREHIHSRTPLVIPDTPAKHHERGMANKPPHAGTLQQPMFIRGHTHARPGPCPTGLCKHPQTRTVHEEVTPT
jgi:hypothetical protein